MIKYLVCNIPQTSLQKSLLCLQYLRSSSKLLTSYMGRKCSKQALAFWNTSKCSFESNLLIYMKLEVLIQGSALTKIQWNSAGFCKRSIKFLTQNLSSNLTILAKSERNFKQIRFCFELRLSFQLEEIAESLK